MVPSQHYKDTYSEEDIEQLCEVGGFAPEDLDAFRKMLEDLAAIYRWENTKFQNLPSYKEVSAELIKIQKQAARLASSLIELGWDAQQAIERGIGVDRMTMITKGTSAPASPTTYLSLQEITGDEINLLLETSDYARLIDGLRNAAEHGQNTLNKRPSKKIPDFGLRLWLINIEKQWQSLNHRPFSRDIDGTGEPITHAGRFCVAAFRKIEPSYSTSRIMNGMKNLKKERRKRTGKAGRQMTL